MPAEILSLDMDWFNYIEEECEIKGEISDFFGKLKKECVLPKAVDLISEHHYLYPWSLKLLDSLGYRKLNIVNIDEHHDFYRLHKIDFEDEQTMNKTLVGNYNFFAFMVRRNLLSRYTWVACQFMKTRVNEERKDLFRGLRDANSLTVRQFRKRISVMRIQDVFDVVRGKQFDGFIIVRSPEYTLKRRAVYSAVDEALRKKLSRISVRRYQCRAKFRSGRVHHRANSLFWEV
ncbi:MAG: hypothetical protein ACXAC5_00730 [Promethearchaeota archaeon]|jgi:hypothetical protein